VICRWKRMFRARASTATIVLGMHKSGTSVVAAIIGTLGINMGKELLGPDASNPTGHYEDMDFLQLNERILEASGGSWLEPPSRTAVIKNRRRFGGEISRLVAERSATHTDWGWKDPRTVITLDLFLPFLPNPRLVVVRRDPGEVAQSLLRRDGTDLRIGWRLAHAYNARIDDILSRTTSPRLELRFRDLRLEPNMQVERVARFLGTDTDSLTLERCARLVMDDEGLRSARSKLQEGAPSDYD
jgi:hypothetical protein